MAGTEGERTGTALPDSERALAAELFNGTWALLERQDRTLAEDDRMLHMAHASRYHWGQVGTPANLARGEWQCSRVYTVLGRSEPALHHARRVVAICQEHGLGDFDLAFGYEAMARAHAVDGDGKAAREWAERARAASADICDPEDRALLLADLDTISVRSRR